MPADFRWRARIARMYSNQVIDHLENPQNMGVLPDANATGIVGTPAHGDVMRLQLKILPVNDVETIVDVKAKVFGCGGAIASVSYLTARIKGRSVAEAAIITHGQIAQVLALPPSEVHCAIRAEDALQAALSDYRRRKAEGSATAYEASGFGGAGAGLRGRSVQSAPAQDPWSVDGPDPSAGRVARTMRLGTLCHAAPSPAGASKGV